jgi:single-strand DNA-binding protein
MASLNKVLLMGNLTRDPELKDLPSGTPLAEFGLAVNRTWTGQDGVKKEEVTFVDCTAFGRLAEVIQEYRKKGDPLFIEGRLKLNQWEAQDGSKRSKLSIIVEGFQFLNRAPANSGGGEGGGGGGGGYGGGRQQQRPQSQSRNNTAPQQGYTGEEAPPLKDDDIPF